MRCNDSMSFGANFFHGNRQQLARDLKGGLVVMAGYDAMQQTNDQAGAFVQEANFWYLTGVTWPGWRMIYDGTRDKCLLVAPKRSAIEITFDGEPDYGALLERCGADEIIQEDDLSLQLTQLARAHSTVYSYGNSVEQNFVLNPAQRRLVNNSSVFFLR